MEMVQESKVEASVRITLGAIGAEEVEEVITRCWSNKTRKGEVRSWKQKLK